MAVGIHYPLTDSQMTTKLLGIAALAAVVLPTASLAQTFAYVNMSGEVNSVEAADAMTALRTAPNIGTHSGVLLLQDDDDSILDDSISMSK